MAVLLIFMELFRFALVPVRRGDDARDGRELRTYRIDLCLNGHKVPRREHEDVVQAVAAPALALVCTGHDDEARLPIANERRARLRQHIRRDVLRLDHGATRRTPATAVNASRSGGGSHMPMTRSAIRGTPTNAAANGNAAT